MPCEVSVRRWSGGGVPVEVPVQVYSWESYHSELNATSGVFFPSPKLCHHLGLGYRPGQCDLHDDIGVASLYRKLGTENISLRGRLAYLRADLLQRYLDETDQALVWLMWGERGVHHRSSEAHNLHEYCADHQHIHKRIYVYQPVSSTQS